MSDLQNVAQHTEGEDKVGSKTDIQASQSRTAKIESKVSGTVSVDSDDSQTSIKKEVQETFSDEDIAVTRIGEWKNMRRIIAEDSDWSLATVPLLRELVVKHIVDNFESNSTILTSLLTKYQKKVLTKISPFLPLKVTALLIDDEGYWERCCRAHWEICDVSSYNNNWKQMYMEKNLQQIIELFVPNTTKPDLLEETITLSANFIKKLDIGQLLPPVRMAYHGPDFDELSDPEEIEDENECDHFNFGSILPKLPFLEELHLCYGVRDCGMNFEWNLFQFTTQDCLQLSQCVAACKTLRVLRVHRSKMDDDKVRVLIGHILNHPGLHELDLSHNIIGDRGARAIGKFLNNQSLLTRLNLCDNQIRVSGAQAIGHALSRNTLLLYLNLRLNRLGDEGGQAICKALVKNRSVVEVNLGSNDLAEPSASFLSQALIQNKVLRSIDLTCNRLGPDGGKQLQEGMEENKTVVHLDLRLTECGQEVEYAISKILYRNQEADRMMHLKNFEAEYAKHRRTTFEPQSTHRYKLPQNAVLL